MKLLWPDEAPPSAAATIRTLVYRIRSALAGADADRHGVFLATTRPGYTLRADPERIDARRFLALVDRAAGAEDDHEKVALLTEGLDLWRGPALADSVTGPVRATLCGDLEESRLQALEARYDAELRLGRHESLIGRLTGFVEEHPNRERAVRQLMLALHRAGRTPDALTVYRQARTRLADQLGLDPTPDLQRLHEAILRADPLLTASPDTDDTGPVAVRPARVTPAQLPADIPDFIGRTAEMGWLDHTMAPGDREAVLVCAVTGAAGVGKTALAVQWAHRNAGRFPDGQLYIDLRGHTVGAPITSGDVLAVFLRSLGVPAEQVPIHQGEQEALYRSVLATRRVLIVLDNAERPAQVRPLLPGSATCAVLVTSRHNMLPLAALLGARTLDLDVLSAADAESLLERILGPDRVTGQGRAVTELAHLCGYLPLALRIAAANLASRPDQSCAAFVAQLTRGNRLAKLSLNGDDEAGVRAAFELTYRTLGDRQRRLFRLLGLVPGPDFDAYVAAALLDAEVADVEPLLAQLTSVHLVKAARDRFQLHDLLRLYARDRCTSEDPVSDTDQAVSRLLEWYLHTAETASSRLVVGFARLARPPGPPPRPLPRFTTPGDAGSWLDTERPNLIAAIRHAAERGPRRYAWYLTDALRGYLWTRHDTAEWLSVGQTGLGAARQEGDPLAESAMHRTIGTAYDSLGESAEALAHHAEALRLSRLVGDRRGEASDLNNLGNLHADLGDVELATDYLTRALALVRALGNRVAEAIGLNNLGMLHLRQGEVRRALGEFAESHALHSETGDPMRAAVVIGNLGQAQWLLGDLTQAVALLTRALSLHRASGDQHRETRALSFVAEVVCDLGRYAQANAHALAALELAREIQDVRVETKARNALGAVHLREGRYREALDECGHALQLARGTGYCDDQIVALVRLSHGHRGVGEPHRALARAGEALELARRTGMLVRAAAAAAARGSAQLERGCWEAAGEDASYALAVVRGAGTRLEEARVLRLRGDIALYRGDRAAALEAWEEARAIFAQVGTPEAADLAAQSRLVTPVR